MILFKIIALFLMLPVFFAEAVIKGAAHFISLVAVMFYAAFRH
jgi:hypothetical protein